jgi:hypothetical protein
MAATLRNNAQPRCATVGLARGPEASDLFDTVSGAALVRPQQVKRRQLRQELRSSKHAQAGQDGAQDKKKQ